MGVSFFLTSSETAFPPCGSCGLRSNPVYLDKQRTDCGTCGGLGGDPVEQVPSLHVSNGNLSTVLMDLLGLGPEELAEPWGELDPEQVLTALASAEAEGKSETFSRDSREVPGPGARMVEGGLSSLRVQQYVETLRRLARAARARGEVIVYG